MNEKAKRLSDRNTFFTYDTEERGSGLEENVRLCSPMFAYVRLCSLNGRKTVAGAARGRSGAGRVPASSADLRFSHKTLQS